MPKLSCLISIRLYSFPKKDDLPGYMPWMVAL